MSDFERTGTLDRAVQAHTELRVFVEIALQGLGWAQNAKQVHDIVAKAESSPSGPEWIEFHRRRAEQAEAFAALQGPKGFPYLWYTASVQLWTILEVMVEDLVLSRLHSTESVQKDSPLNELEGPLLTFLNSSAEQRAEHLLTLLKEKTRAGLKMGVGRFEALLQPVGLGGPYPERIRRVLLELSQVRNVITHRGGIIDRRFRESCPWLETPIGQALPLTQAHFRIYSISVDWFTLELSRRLSETYGPGEMERVVQVDLEAKLAEMLEACPKGPSSGVA